jgi:hypothetical protein
MPPPCFHCRIDPTVKSRTSPPPRFQECIESCPPTPRLQSRPPANPYQLSSSNPGHQPSPLFLTLQSWPPIPAAISTRRQLLPKSSSNPVRPSRYMPCAASPPVLQISTAISARCQRLPKSTSIPDSPCARLWRSSSSAWLGGGEGDHGANRDATDGAELPHVELLLAGLSAAQRHLQVQDGGVHAHGR